MVIDGNTKCSYDTIGVIVTVVDVIVIVRNTNVCSNFNWNAFYAADQSFLKHDKKLEPILSSIQKLISTQKYFRGVNSARENYLCEMIETKKKNKKKKLTDRIPENINKRTSK